MEGHSEGGRPALQAADGRGVLLGLADGAAPASVVIIGSGNVGRAAAALGARVTVLARCESSRATYSGRAPVGNQMAVDIPLARLLASVARFLAPDGLFLAQFLAPGAACGFYDPGLADGDWHQDRQFAGEDGHLITRRRRQHHQDGLVHVGFELASVGNPVHCQQVTLRPMPIADVQMALADAGLRTLRTGSGGFAEILGVRQSRRLEKSVRNSKSHRSAVCRWKS